MRTDKEDTKYLFQQDNPDARKQLEYVDACQKSGYTGWYVGKVCNALFPCKLKSLCINGWMTQST